MRRIFGPSNRTWHQQMDKLQQGQGYMQSPPMRMKSVLQYRLQCTLPSGKTEEENTKSSANEIKRNLCGRKQTSEGEDCHESFKSHGGMLFHIFPSLFNIYFRGLFLLSRSRRFCLS